MDPVSIVGLVGTVIGLMSKSAKIATDLNQLAQKYRNTKSTLQRIINECHTLEAAAGQIKIWVEVKLSKMPPNHQQQMSPLRNALKDFAALLEPLDADVTGMLNKAISSGDVPFSVKFSSLWNEQRMKEYLDDLRWQANAIHFLLSATQLVPEESIKRMESIAYAASQFREGSLFNDSGSTIDNLEFEFDHLLINTATYRRAFKSHVQRPSDLSEVPTNTKVDDDIASYISRAKMRGDRITAVHLASESGQTEILRECIDAGFNISLKTSTEGWTPLHYAAENNHESAVKLLLEHGAENLPDNQGYTPLHIAATKPGAAPIVNCFLEQLDCNSLSVKESELTPLHIAAREGRYDLMEHILGTGLADIRDKNGLSLLHFACAYNQVQFVKFLLGLKVDVNARGNWQFKSKRLSMTSLGLAIRFQNPELGRLLLDHGASQENVDGDWSAIQTAITKGNIDIINLLAPAIDFKTLNFLCKHMTTEEPGTEPALNFACYSSASNKLAVIKLLVDQGCPLDGLNTWSASVLQEAAAKNDVEVAAFLLECGADIHIRNTKGYTPLHYSTRYGAVDMVRLLLENSASPSRRTENGKTPLELGFRKETMDKTPIDEEMKKEIRGLLRFYMAKEEEEEEKKRADLVN